LIFGTLPKICYAEGMTSHLYAKQVRIASSNQRCSTEARYRCNSSRVRILLPSDWVAFPAS